MLARLQAVATATPSYAIDQKAAAELARHLFGPVATRLGPVHDNAGIAHRWSCVPAEWYAHPHGWRERGMLFAENAITLAEQAATACLERAGLAPQEVDAVVAVSTTGMCTPSLDALLLNRLGLRPDLTRLPIFGLGCAGGPLGLARAAALAQAMPGGNVLLVVVELCGLTFRPQDRSAANVIATALFGDGAGAALLSTSADGPVILAWGEHTWPASLDVMGWRIEDDGFGVVFSRDIPPLIAGQFRPALDQWLRRQGMALSDIRRFVCHPGGAKVIAALETALDLPDGTLALEREVLRDHGNMSAATVLFVLERALSGPLPRTLMTALGPGFTAAFVALEG